MPNTLLWYKPDFHLPFFRPLIFVESRFRFRRNHAATLLAHNIGIFRLVPTLRVGTQGRAELGSGGGNSVCRGLFLRVCSPSVQPLQGLDAFLPVAVVPGGV